VRYLSTYHRWYAWHPVRCKDGTWVWLEEVEKKGFTGFWQTGLTALMFMDFDCYTLPTDHHEVLNDV
jgi:hypothetical protein